MPTFGALSGLCWPPGCRTWTASSGPRTQICPSSTSREKSSSTLGENSFPAEEACSHTLQGSIHSMEETCSRIALGTASTSGTAPTRWEPGTWRTTATPGIRAHQLATAWLAPSWAKHGCWAKRGTHAPAVSSCSASR
uniref:Uncharacterized protein n=1 Tax=Ixodes ricinus TaxID=34613 RepID=A0A6B0USU8_IXORI